MKKDEEEGFVSSIITPTSHLPQASAPDDDIEAETQQSTVVKIVMIGSADNDGHPLPDFSAADCDCVDLNYLAYTVTWRGKASQAMAASQIVRIEIRLNSAKLYAMEIRSITMT